MSQKELQRVSVISSCVKGSLTCARAAALLDLTLRYVTTQIALSARRGGGSGARQPREAQSPPFAGTHTRPHSAFGSHHLP